MTSDSNIAQLFLRLDLEQTPPTVEYVGVGVGQSSHPLPGIAIITWAKSSNISEAHRALCGIVTSDPKYAWTHEWPDVATFIQQWSKP